MKMNDSIKVRFEGIAWKNTGSNLPSSIILDIPCKFFCDPIQGTDECRVCGDSKDLHDIFAAYLLDELGECPDNFTFYMQFKQCRRHA